MYEGNFPHSAVNVGEDGRTIHTDVSPKETLSTAKARHAERVIYQFRGSCPDREEACGHGITFHKTNRYCGTPQRTNLFSRWGRR
jgi:hypothetical protein